ncbi:MAG: class I SAM-dependent methyltransferase [Bacteroides sp.]|nr:class I SAM-dependent methyltransferase [Bacteroides sp.]
MKENKDVVAYYDELAPNYDASRFSGSYGNFIHKQEQNILKHFLPTDARVVVDLACGTGRLSDYATICVDASEQMLKQAQSKHKEKQFIVAPAHDIPLASETCDAIFSFHLIMHLKPEYVKELISEAYRLLRPGGCLIFDFPSQLRRGMSRRNIGGWHGNTTFTLADIPELLPSGMKISTSSGIMLSPVHALPSWLRKAVLPVDTFLCRTWLKNYASYIAVKIVKSC